MFGSIVQKFKKPTLPSPMGVFPGYGVNVTARLTGADLEPIPVRPVRHQNQEWDVQLHNGYMKITTLKVSGDHYLRLLSHKQPGQMYQPLPLGMPKIGPAPANVQSFYDRTAGAQPTNPGGPGFILPGLVGPFEGA